MADWYAVAALVAALAAWLHWPPELENDLRGKIAIVTGGGRGAGRGLALGLLEAGATVYVTGRTPATIQETCALAAALGGVCIPKTVDNSVDGQLETLFADVAKDSDGRLDILVNNAFSALAFAGQHGLLGKPFWEQPMQLFDEVHQVGVRSHFKATQLAVPMMQRAGGGLIVNTNSPGCVLYALNVPYGMGKCAVDKMVADTAMELATEGIEVVSWWAGVPMQTEEILAGNVDGGSWRRGAAPGIQWVPSFKSLYHTALATTTLFEGRVLAALARDVAGRARASGLAVISSQLGRRYGVTDERGLCPPSFLSVKYQLSLWLPPFFDLARIPGGDAGQPAATPAQRFYFNVLPNFELPLALLKLVGGPPLTFQWPIP